MGLLRQEYWVRLPFPLPGELPNQGIKPASPELACGFFIAEPLGKPPWNVVRIPNKGRNNTWTCGTISTIRQKFPCFPMWISQKPSLPSSQWEKTWTNWKSRTLLRIYQKTEVTRKTTATPNWRSRQIKGTTAHQQQNVLDLWGENSKPHFNNTWTFRCSSWFYKRQRNQRSNCQHLLDHQKTKRAREKHLFLFYRIWQCLWLCGSQ